MYQLIQQAPLRWPDPKRHGISVSDEAKDLIEKLLEKDRFARLGQTNDVDDVMAHPFFKTVNQEALLLRQIKADFIPTIDSSGLNNFDADIISERPEESMVPTEILKKIKAHEDNFKEFGFTQSLVNQGPPEQK